MISRKVIFYAPIGNLTKGFKSGGAEAGCKKTMAILVKNGYEILLVEKPSRDSDSVFDGIVLLFRLFKVWRQLIYLSLKNRNAVLHIAGFYLNQIYFEWLLIKTARLLKIKTIYEIRNGGMTEAFSEGGAVYKFFMKSVLLSTNEVLCQGYDYVIFLKENFKKSSFYYPNYIMDSFIEKNNKRDNNTLRLIYFGRVVPEKNIDFILEICYKLKLLNIPFELNVIGSYEDNYFKILSKSVETYDIVKNTNFLGRMEFEGIHNILKTSHIFIFPSKEKREGHSNSLTEAMGDGVVPIASNVGFNKSVIHNPELIIDDFNSDVYASTIDQLWRSGKWQKLSDEVHNRVATNYTESIVKESLLSLYRKMYL